MWHQITLDTPIQLRKGDLLSPKRPSCQDTVVYIVTGLKEDGSLDLISKSLNYAAFFHNTEVDALVKPEKLRQENWWIYVKEQE